MTRGYAIALAGCLALAGFADVVLGPGPFLLATFAVTALAVVALVRPDRRWSVPAAAGSLLLTAASVSVVPWAGAGFGLAEAGALVLLVVASTRRSEGWRGWVVTGLAALAVPVLPYRLGASEDSPVLASGLVVVVAVAVAVGSSLRGADAARRAAVTAVRRSEREEVARELHDVVAHHVTGMVVATQAARLVAAQPGAPLDPVLASIEAAGTEALTAMRRLVGVLRSDPDDPSDPTGGEAAGPTGPGRRTPVPQVAELSELVRRFETATDAVSVQLRGTPAELGDLPGELQSTLYRLTQEALTNTARHAPGAERVVVEVARGGGEVSVQITDSGAPGTRPRRVPAPAGGGFGLVGMRERAEVLGGSVTAGPHEGGWLVRAVFPDPAAAAGGPVASAGGARPPRSRRREGRS